MNIKYRGIVIDRLTGKTVYMSQPATWAEAHTKAERKARSLGCGDRFDIKVTEMGVDEEARREAARILGKAGGSVKSEKKAAAARENGKKGGRTKKKKEEINEK